jgi:ankyrin repeat protein
MTWTKLQDAAEHQDATGVIKRVHKNSDEAVFVDDHASTPLHTLCWGNPNLDAVHELIRAFPQAVTDQDILGNTPLHVAAGYPGTSAALIQLLLKTEPTATSIVNHEGLMPLHMACRYAPKNEEVILLLLEQFPYAARHQIKMGEPAPRNASDFTTRKEGDHAVTDAAARAAMDAVQLRFDAFREGEKRDGAYPIHMAIAAGASKRIIEALILEADDVTHMTNKYGETPLHIAVATRTKEYDLVELILTAFFGAACLADKRNGDLPLHVAVVHGCPLEVAKRLLETFPMAAQQRNIHRKLPLDLAIASGTCTEEVISFLRQTKHYEESKKNLMEKRD